MHRPTLVAMILAAACISAARAETVLIAKSAYPEGPLWQNGKLLFVEYAGPGVKVWDGKKAKPYWSAEHCGASGLIAYRSSHLLVACYDANTIVELDESGIEVRVIDKDGAGKSFVGPNDFTSDQASGIYISASGIFDLKAPIGGAILYLPRGQDTPTEVANLIHYPNGLTLSKDGKHLLGGRMATTTLRRTVLAASWS